MFFVLVYLLLRRLVQLVAGSNQLNRDIELVVLRHQLKVLNRQVSRRRLRHRDRLFMAAISRALPRPRWSSFVVSPQDAPSLAPRPGAEELDLQTRLRRQATDPR